MRRVWLLLPATAIAFAAGPSTARAAMARPVDGAVTALSIVPAIGRAEVVIGLSGPVDVQDFTLAGPDRIVIDVSGAVLDVPPRLYDHVARGGITNVRVAQYTDDVVRVVLELDGKHQYTVMRDSGAVHVTLDGVLDSFPAWFSSRELSSDAVAGTTADAGTVVATTRSVAGGSARAAAARQSMQPRITVTYQDADIRDVLAAFATFSGRTIVVGKSVQGTVTAEIRDQPWDVALKAILQAQGLAASEDPTTGIITVDSYENLTTKAQTEPLVTQLVSINYAHAGALASTIRLLLSKDCSSAMTRPGTAAVAGPAGEGQCVTRGSVGADTATNTLIISEVASRMDDLLGYVKDLDVRTPQVAIKAKIIFVDRTDIEALGVSYDLGTQTQFFNKLVQRPDPRSAVPTDLNGDGIPDALVPTKNFASTEDVINLGGNQLSAIANANQRIASSALSMIFSTVMGGFDLSAFLDALQEVRLADIQAEPTITTLDNQKASILVGEETPIRVIDAGAQTGGAAGGNNVPRATVSFKETGIILTVTPHITNNRQVLMVLHSERSNLEAAASDLGFTFQKQAADNQLLVGDGETAVIGGLTVTQVTVSKSGIPILVDLPLIGRLFGQTTTQDEKRDLIILVTPHIVDEGEAVGQSTGNR